MYPETLWVPVIYYDYRADSTNPDFQAHYGGTVPVTGMVQDTLGSDLKPISTNGAVNVSTYSTNLNNWYRPSGNLGEVPAVFGYSAATMRWEWTGLQPYLGRADEWVGPYFDPNDPMANVVIYDSLPFVLIGHSKTFTAHNERSLRPFLEFVAERPDRFSFGTFADFEAERYRVPIAA